MSDSKDKGKGAQRHENEAEDVDAAGGAVNTGKGNAISALARATN